MASFTALSARATATASLSMPSRPSVVSKQCKPSTLLLASSPLQPQLASKKLINHSYGLRGASVNVNVGAKIKASGAVPGAMAPIPKKKLEVFEKEEELAESLASYVVDLSGKYTKGRGSFNVVLSGGPLIRSLRKLTEQPYVDSIDWSKWNVFWVEERVVSKDSIDSNYRQACDGLLTKVPIILSNVYAINDALSVERAADDYENRIKELVYRKAIDTSPVSGLPKFDLMLLGVGPEGEVASIFPGHFVVKEEQKWVAHIKDSPKPPQQRITFTFPVINASANIALVATGASQARVVRTALGRKQLSGIDPPVKNVSPEGELKWFLDKDAAFFCL